MNEQSSVKMLKADHRKVEELFTEFYGENDQQERAEVANKIVKELEIHMQLEEELFYPKVEEFSKEGKDLGSHAREEHQEVKKLMSGLKHRTDIDENNEKNLRQIDMLLQDHIKDEEEKMFPFAEKNLQEEMGMGFSAKMLALKEKLRMQNM